MNAITKKTTCSYIGECIAHCIKIMRITLYVKMYLILSFYNMNVYINSQWSKVLEYLYFDYQEHKLENKLILYTTLFHQSKFCKGLFYLMKLLCKIIIYT